MGHFLAMYARVLTANKLLSNFSEKFIINFKSPRIDIDFSVSWSFKLASKIFYIHSAIHFLKLVARSFLRRIALIYLGDCG